MQINSYSLDKESKKIKNEILNNISKVIDHNKYINGPENSILERKLSTILKSKNCILTSSGTDALLISLIAIGIKEGDEIITSPFTFISTIEVILSMKAKPILIDIDPETYNIDINKINNYITKKTRAIIPVSLFGQPANLKLLKKNIKKNKGIKIIEDNAQSLMSKHHGEYSNYFTDISCTSFFPTKVLGCYGDGGAIFTDNKILSDKIKKIRSHGSINKKNYDVQGVSGRMDTLQSAIILTKLKYLRKNLSNRSKIATTYNKIIDKINSSSNKDLIKKPKILDFNQSVYAQYTIQIENRNKLKEFLKRHNISTAIYYDKIVSDYSYYKNKCRFKDLKNASKISKQVLSLPINDYQTSKETKYVCDVMYSFFKKN